MAITVLTRGSWGIVRGLDRAIIDDVGWFANEATGRSNRLFWILLAGVESAGPFSDCWRGRLEKHLILLAVQCSTNLVTIHHFARLAHDLVRSKRAGTDLFATCCRSSDR